MSVVNELSGVTTDVDSQSSDLLLSACVLDDQARAQIVASTQHRPMLDAPGPTFAVRCLPMLIGSQAGWLLMNTADVTLTWNGGDACSDIDIQTTTGLPHPHVRAHEKGEGYVVWRSGYGFQTDPEWDLVAKAPANWPRRGAYGMDKLYATGRDQSPSPARMIEVEVIWKLLEPNYPVVFKAAEPFGMIVPIERRAFDPGALVRLPIDQDEVMMDASTTWRRSRGYFKQEMLNPGSISRRESWQKDYFRGHHQNGNKFPDHQTKLRIQDFPACPFTTDRSLKVDEPTNADT